MSRIGPQTCDRCGIQLTPCNHKTVPVGDPSPYVRLCFSCWDELQQIEVKIRGGVVTTLKINQPTMPMR
jgi:hypothetical protein